MYETFYGLKEKPFSLLPDPGFLFLSRKHSTAYAMLQYGISQQAGFVVIAGEVGSGKTTLIRHLLNHLEENVTVGLISNTHASFGELMQWVALAFNLEYKGREKVELFAEFQQFIIDEYAAGRRTVLIIDEAQNMSVETLEELRMLSNINADKDQVIQLILVGQPELRTTLRRPQLRQFAQRVSVAYYLESLTNEETGEYIRHRLRVTGGDEDLFTEDAIRLVYQYSEGVPRVINSLCDTALVYGFAEQTHRIDAAVIEEVTRDKSQSGLFGDALPGEEEEAAEQDAAAPDTTHKLHRL